MQGFIQIKNNQCSQCGNMYRTTSADLYYCTKCGQALRVNLCDACKKQVEYFCPKCNASNQHIAEDNYGCFLENKKGHGDIIDVVVASHSSNSIDSSNIISTYSFTGNEFLKWLRDNSTTTESYNSKKGYLGLLFKKLPNLEPIEEILRDIDSVFSKNDRENIIDCLNKLYAFIYYLSYTNHKGLTNNLKDDLRKYASSGLKPYISWLEKQTPSIKKSNRSWKSKWDKCLKDAFNNNKLDGNNSLFAYSFVGIEEDKSNNDTMELKLIQHAVRSSYFFDYKSCKIENRHNEIMDVYSGRKSEGNLYKEGIPYRESDRSKKQRAIMNSSGGQVYPVLPDNNGNLYVRTLIKDKTGYDLNPNDPDFVNFTISHIWGNAPSPLFFTNLWNIVLVPTWINYLLDKKNQGPNSLATKIRDTFKAICVKQYEMESLNWEDFPYEQKPELDNFPKKKTGEYIINVIKAPLKEEPMGRITSIKLNI